MSYAEFLVSQLGIFMAAASLLLLNRHFASTAVSAIGLLAALVVLLSAMRVH